MLLALDAVDAVVVFDQDTPLEGAGANISGQVIIVTGGASGLGLAVVESLARLAAVPVVFDMAEAPTPFNGMVVDVADAAAVAQVASSHGRLHAVVACAGIGRPGRLDVVAGADWVVTAPTETSWP